MWLAGTAILRYNDIEEANSMSKVALESRVLRFIHQHGLIGRGQTVVVAVSGGPDSVCLLHILAGWHREAGVELHIAHLDHQLRGAESQAEAEYVSALADSLGIHATIDSRDVAAYRAERNCSLEEAARELRYEFLAGVAQQVGAHRIALGHTRDDQVETILMHILRGAGTAGLSGLVPCAPLPSPHLSSRVPMGSGRSNPLLIRPLLDITREETARYCQEHGLDPRADSSNLSLSLLRNRLRLQLLPLLRQYNPSVDQALLRLADIAGEDNAFIEHQASAMWQQMARQEDDAVRLNRRQLAALPAALQRRLLRAAMARVQRDVRDIQATHIEAARALLHKPAGKEVCLPHGLVCQGGYEDLVITRDHRGRGDLPSVIVGQAKQSRPEGLASPPLAGESRLTVPGQTLLPGWRVTAAVLPRRSDERHSRASTSGPWQPSPAVTGHTTESRPKDSNPFVAYLDLQKAGNDLSVRPRRTGDRFQPLGMSEAKKLQDFMVDAKIPRSHRPHVPIVCSPQHIIWIVGWRIDDRVKVTAATREVLRLEFVRQE